jgi:hypothetical protein
LVERARHLCEVDWIKSELAALGVSANVAQIACFSDEQRARVIRWPAQFSVLTYIGKGRERFYGFDKIINMAQEFPSIPFRVAGISDWPGPIPPNLHLLGWVKNMEEEYEKCVLFLRLTEHDGLAFSVLEAFSYGRYVAYSHNFPPAEHTPCLDTLRRSIRELSVRFDQDNLGPNHEAQAIILREFAKTKVMSDLRKELFLA